MACIHAYNCGNVSYMIKKQDYFLLTRKIVELVDPMINPMTNVSEVLLHRIDDNRTIRDMLMENGIDLSDAVTFVMQEIQTHISELLLKEPDMDCHSVYRFLFIAETSQQKDEESSKFDETLKEEQDDKKKQFSLTAILSIGILVAGAGFLFGRLSKR